MQLRLLLLLLLSGKLPSGFLLLFLLALQCGFHRIVARASSPHLQLLLFRHLDGCNGMESKNVSKQARTPSYKQRGFFLPSLFAARVHLRSFFAAPPVPPVPPALDLLAALLADLTLRALMRVGSVRLIADETDALLGLFRTPSWFRSR